MASPGISYWLEATIHSLFHSLCPLGLITINLTPCLSDAAARSAGLGEMFTKAMDHQHFDCGTPNCHFSFCPRWSHQPSVPVISVQRLVPVSVLAPGKPTWRPVTLCLSVVPLSPSETNSASHILLALFCVSVDGIFLWIGLLQHTVRSAFLRTSGSLTFHYPNDRVSVQTWSLPPASDPTGKLSVIVFEDWLKKRRDFTNMASFKLDFLPEMMVDHCSLNSSPV